MTDLSPSYERTPDLPLFEAPPVHDVSISVQFQPLPIRAVDLGTLRHLFAEFYPHVDELPPTPLQVENLSSGRRSGFEVRFTIMDRPPLPMLVFTSEDQASQVQLQADRFACVWRRTEDADYPRYSSLRDDFIRNSKIFTGFVEDAADGIDVGVFQADLTYVNLIPMPAGERPDVLAAALPSPDLAEGGPRISSTIVNHALTFQNSEGVDYARLHVSAEPVLIKGDQNLRLSLTYRGEPWERDEGQPGLATLMRFFDEAHDVIVRTFAANTTTEAQRVWRRIQ